MFSISIWEILQVLLSLHLFEERSRFWATKSEIFPRTYFWRRNYGFDEGGWIFLLYITLEGRLRFERLTLHFLLKGNEQFEWKKRKNCDIPGETDVLNILGFSEKHCIIEVIRTGGRYGGVIWKISQASQRKTSHVAKFRQWASLAPNTLTRLMHDVEVSLSVFGKICQAWDVNFGNLVDYVPDPTLIEE